MRYLAAYLTALILLLVVLPWVMVGTAAVPELIEPPGSSGALSLFPTVSSDPKELGGAATSLAEPQHNIENIDTPVQLWRAKEQVSEWLPLEEYITRVAAAEMPALFQEAALQAQAVAIRTYTLKHMQLQDKRATHPGGDLCDQPGHCQAYAAPAELQQNWQQAYVTYWRRISDAVQSTTGLVLSYRGVLIDALYHSTCGGRTEYASEVWGGSPLSQPYLVAVDCPWDQASQRYSNSVFFSWDELGGRLGLREEAAQVAWLGSRAWTVTAFTSGGRVREAVLLGREFNAVSLRGQLGLNSTQLSVSQSSAGLTFETTGYGHGVGLCQYGADGYAKTGASYIEILGHYYQGVVILPDYGR